MNYVWLHPLVVHFKDRVPGGTVLTDIWLYLNHKCDGKLLPKPGITVEIQAAEEAGRCKRLLGALRYLYRNSAFDLGLNSSFQSPGLVSKNLHPTNGAPRRREPRLQGR